MTSWGDEVAEVRDQVQWGRLFDLIEDIHGELRAIRSAVEANPRERTINVDGVGPMASSELALANRFAEMNRRVSQSERGR